MGDDRNLRLVGGQRNGRVTLIGLPGAGKSSVGCLLADELEWVFYDCDAAFEAQAGIDIAGWVGERGWAAFREREGALLASALARSDIVIATGGGVVEDEKNRRMLSASTTVVWLDASLEVLSARLGSATDRPLLAGAPLERLQELADGRNPLYAALADLRIDVSASDPSRIAADIAGELASRGGV